MPARSRSRLVLVFFIAAFFNFAIAAGADPRAAGISGRVLDPLGAGVPGAAVVLVHDGRPSSNTTTDAKGHFEFQNVAGGRYQIEVKATGFASRTLDPFFVGATAPVVLDIALTIGVKAQVVVTAEATEVPAAEIGAPVTVVDQDTLTALGRPDVLEALRAVPGVNVVQSGARGSLTSLFIRGGASTFNKVLIDGVAANDIGGRFDFGDIAATGVNRLEVLRDANSVIHGSDAIAGVVAIATAQGRTRLPAFTYSGDAGNFRTSRNEVTFGGAANRVDYFTAFSQFQTDNNLPNSADRNRTFASRVGVDLGSHTVLTTTVRWFDTKVGTPNSFAFFGIADDTVKTSRMTLASVTADSQLSSRWQTSVRFGVMDEVYHTVNPSPTGQPYDPFGFGPIYLGNVVTITGANGYSTTGQSLLDFSGPYPMRYNQQVRREQLFGEATYRANREFSVSIGGRAEHESGFTQFISKSTTDRTNGGGFVEVRQSDRRLLSSVGVGVEHNAIFGTAVTPRVSATFYARTPSPGAFGDTKITANAGSGIKGPTIDQGNSSLFVLLRDAGVPSASIGPIGPERARTFDVGVDQGVWRGRGRVRVSFFDNHFSNLIEFVSNTALPLLGISPSAAAASGYGAYVNSSSYWARGLEASSEWTAGPIRVTGSYTFIDAQVTRSFSSSALGPSENPLFPGIAIGAFSPLMGARPFRIPTHSGNVVVIWTHRAWQAALAGFFTGRADDSTFLFDKDSGNTLLLPNHNLDAGYQKIDLSVSWQVHSRLRWFASVENVLNERFQAAIGFPALSRTFRTGFTVRAGGVR